METNLSLSINQKHINLAAYLYRVMSNKLVPHLIYLSKNKKIQKIIIMNNSGQVAVLLMVPIFSQFVQL